MGRQVGFYFTDRDEEEFLELSQLQGVVLLRSRQLASPLCEEVQLKPFQLTSNSDSQTLACFVSDKKELTFREIEGRGSFYIDDCVSPVIEFSRSGYRPDLNMIISGRLWYEHKYWTKDEDGNDVLREKSKELEKLYNSLARWIRKHCTRLPNGNYIAPHAQELHENGADLSP